MIDHKNGRILHGNAAPTTLNLKKWIQENPTFQVYNPDVEVGTIYYI